MGTGAGWPLILFLVTVIALGVVLRRRYGNIFLRLTNSFEAATGLTMRHVVAIFGLLTLVVWALVYGLFGPDEKGSLEGLFKGVFEGGGGAPSGDSAPAGERR